MISTRIELKNRIPLYELLPLEAPLTLFIDPADCCNLKCAFCPTSDLQLMKEVGRPLRPMLFNVYKDIIDDLQEFNTKVKVVRLYSHGEPLLNRHFCDMVKYAKASDKVETVDTTTNGLKLNSKLNQQLVDSGLDRINISINGLSDDNYLDFADTKVYFNNLVENIADLYKRSGDSLYVFIKINGDTISKADEEKFLRIFEPIADAVGIEKSMACWNGFEMKSDIKPNSDLGVYGQPLTHVDICPYIFYSMAIQSDGLVSLCFLDWSRKMIIGDINNESVKEIWEGTRLVDLRYLMLNGQRKNHPICKDCDQLVRGMPENLDDYRDILIEVYKEYHDDLTKK